MGFFRFGRKDKVIDLSGKYGKKEVEPGRAKEEPSDSFSIFGNLTSASSGSSRDEGDFSGESKKKIAKKLVEIANKLDEISTQIYHLQQRVELLEIKAGVRTGS
jgi:hypothetical protein